LSSQASEELRFDFTSEQWQEAACERVRQLEEEGFPEELQRNASENLKALWEKLSKE